MHVYTLALTIFTFTAAGAVYIPGAEDWTQLKPPALPLLGSIESLPFKFGLYVNPYKYNSDDGEYEEPEYSSVTRTYTTTFTTSYITTAPKPVKSVDVLQIQDGQVQRHRTNPGNNEVNEDYEGEEEVDEGEENNEETFEELAVGPHLMKRLELVDEKLFASKDVNLKKRHEDGDGCSDDEGDDAAEADSPVVYQSCRTSYPLAISIEDGILRDEENRIGSIVGSRQFQFDGPDTPQYGTIYAAGWSITNKGQLALGNTTKFYQCASGDFFNLYDQSIGFPCDPVVFDVVELIDCEN